MCVRRSSGIDERRHVVGGRRRLATATAAASAAAAAGRYTGDHEHDGLRRRRLRGRGRPLRGQRLFAADADHDVQDDAVQPDQFVFHAVAARPPSPGPVHHPAPFLAVRRRQRGRVVRRTGRRRHVQQRGGLSSAAAHVRTGRQRTAAAAAAAADASSRAAAATAALVRGLGHRFAPSSDIGRRGRYTMRSQETRVVYLDTEEE